MRFLKNLFLWLVRPLDRRGWFVVSTRINIVPPEVRSQILECSKKSLCPFLHFEAVWRALTYLNTHQIKGDVVLCGVAKGGLAKFMLKHLGDRRLWLYDTFDGGTLPGSSDSEYDREVGQRLKKVMASDVQTVRAYLDDSRCRFVVGDVMKTLPQRQAQQIALLYLDTDWADCTLHELKCLYPLVVTGGIVAQDDMGICVGARQAVNTYFKHYPPFMLPMSEAGFMWKRC